MCPTGGPSAAGTGIRVSLFGGYVQGKSRTKPQFLIPSPLNPWGKVVKHVAGLVFGLVPPLS